MIVEHGILGRLMRARTLLDRGWTQRAFARDAAGKACRPTRAAACSWSLLGAVWAVSTDEPDAYITDTDFADAMTSVIQQACDSLLSSWNDRGGRTHADVLEAVDRAIATVQKG